MPFCPQCGVENPSSARFCDQCGAVLIAVPVQGRPVVPATPVSPAPAPAPAPAPVAGQATAGPSTCPQCGTAVIPGEAFCDNCGAALLGGGRPAPAAAPTLPYGGVPAQPSYPPPQPAQPTPYAPPVAAKVLQPTPPPAPAPPPAPQARPPRATLSPASLIVRANGAVVPLPAVAQAIVGRADPVSNFFPDLDLAPQGAIESGVGRRHARLFVQGSQIMIEDLDSTNGTFRNGVRLPPRQPTPLANGDELRLGNLTLALQL